MTEAEFEKIRGDMKRHVDQTYSTAHPAEKKYQAVLYVQNEYGKAARMEFMKMLQGVYERRNERPNSCQMKT